MSNLKHQPISVYASIGNWRVDTTYLHGNNFDPSPWTNQRIGPYGPVTGVIFSNGNGPVQLFFAGSVASGLPADLCVGPAETVIRPMIAQPLAANPAADDSVDASEKWLPDATVLTKKGLECRPLDDGRFNGTAIVDSNGTLVAFYRGSEPPGDCCSAP